MGIDRKYFEPKSNMKPRWQAMWGDFAEDVHVISRSPDAVSDYGFTFAGWTPSSRAPPQPSGACTPTASRWCIASRPASGLGRRLRSRYLHLCVGTRREKERHKAKARSMILAKLRKRELSKWPN